MPASLVGQAAVFAYELRDDRAGDCVPLVLALCTNGLPALRNKEASFLSEPERVCLRRFAGDARALGFLRGRWAAKNALVQGFGGQHRQWRIVNGVFGQPVAQFDAGAKPPVCVSISHSSAGALALAVPAACPAAIDCEVVCAQNLDAMRDHMSGDEVAAAAACGLSEVDALTMLWSLKESACKLLGAGLNVDFQVLEMTGFVFNGGGQLRAQFRHFAHIQGQALQRGGHVASLAFPASCSIVAGDAAALERELAVLCNEPRRIGSGPA